MHKCDTQQPEGSEITNRTRKREIFTPFFQLKKIRISSPIPRCNPKLEGQ